LQILAVVLKMSDNYDYYKRYTDAENSLAFADAAYNGGLGGLNNERRACQIASNCDPAIWVGNVELFCLKSKAALYGNRSACDINRHHVTDVLITRAPKYKKFFID
jgi:membrane-bound lytic murein transglycosylase MltF